MASVYKVEVVLRDGTRKYFKGDKVAKWVQHVWRPDILYYREYMADGSIHGGVTNILCLSDDQLMDWIGTDDLEKAKECRRLTIEAQTPKADNDNRAGATFSAKC